MDNTAPYPLLNHGEMLNWYRIERVLGRGGFGVIYLATDTNLQHQVAIKEYRVLEQAGDFETKTAGFSNLPAQAKACCGLLTKLASWCGSSTPILFESYRFSSSMTLRILLWSLKKESIYLHT
jgi:hypothetical protein